MSDSFIRREVCGEIRIVKCGHEIGILTFKRTTYFLDGDVGECTAVVDVFHVAATGFIKRVKDRVASAVEIERLDAAFCAQRSVERGGGFDPAAIEKNVGIAVPVEDVGAHAFFQTIGGQMVSDIGVTKRRGDTDRAAAGGKESGFGNAPSETAFECG